jgi:hypothetical protein
VNRERVVAGAQASPLARLDCHANGTLARQSISMQAGRLRSSQSVTIHFGVVVFVNAELDHACPQCARIQAE